MDLKGVPTKTRPAATTAPNKPPETALLKAELPSGVLGGGLGLVTFVLQKEVSVKKDIQYKANSNIPVARGRVLGSSSSHKGSDGKSNNVKLHFFWGGESCSCESM